MECKIRYDHICQFYAYNELAIWNTADGSFVHSLPHHNNTYKPLLFDVDDDESVVMAGGQDGKLRIWALDTGHLLKEHDIPSTYATLRSDDDRLAIGSCKFVKGYVLLFRGNQLEYWQNFI